MYSVNMERECGMRPEKSSEVTTGQAARILGMSNQGVHHLAKNGCFAFRVNEFGWKIFIRKEIEEYAKKRKALRDGRTLRWGLNG